MMSKPPGSGSRKPGDKPQARSGAGSAGPGEIFDPTALPDEHVPEKTTPRPPRAAPAPGVPVSDAELERMKKKAAGARTPPSRHAQSDPSGEKPK
jgi:hypothetical protein